MKLEHSRRLAALAALLSAAFVASCSDSKPTAGEQIDRSVAVVQQKGAEIKSDVKQGVDELKEKTSEITSSAKQTLGDASITAEVNRSLAKDPSLGAMKFDVDTAHGQVTLKGTAPDAASQVRATKLAQAVDGVTSVDNRLTVKQ